MRLSPETLVLRLRGIRLAVLLVTAVSTQAPAANPTPVPANPSVSFAHTQSDLAVDPAARFGRLPNGMSYVLYKNKTPPGTASVWMRVDAGSLMEQEDQRGLAHFIEHMVFKGSKNVPEGEMVRLLQRDGLAFGADTNAQTEAFQTIYKLNLPDASERVISDALFLMREAAGNVSLKPGAIESERGVILGEERVRSTVASRANEALLKELLPGTKYPERHPIGKVEVIKTAQRDAFARYYNDFYRPEYTTLIVVGDFNPDRVEADIRRKFGDWKAGPRSASGPTQYGALEMRSSPTAKIHVADGLQDSIAVFWPQKPGDAVQTKEKDYSDLRFMFASAVLNERLVRAANSPGATFMGAGFQREELKKTARLYSLSVFPKEGQDRAAMEQVLGMLREFMKDGPTQAELDRAILNFENFLRSARDSSKTVPTQDIANQIVNTIANNNVLQSPAQALAEFEELKPRFTLQSIAGAINDVALGQGPLIWRQGKDAKALDEAGMLDAYRTAWKMSVSATASHAAAAWPYVDFGKPSAVISREALPTAGATRATFANGVVLTVKQTDFEQRVVRVEVQLGTGRLGLSGNQRAQAFMAQQLARINVGGLGKLSSDDITEALAGKTVGLNFGIETSSVTLHADTTSTDVATQLQLLTAFITDPGLRADAFDRVKESLPSSFNSARTSTDGIMFLKGSGDVYGGDGRFAAPSLAEVMAVKHADVVALMTQQLGTGPIEVTIVGDISTDEAIRQVGATLGAIPKRSVKQLPQEALAVRFPTTDLHRVYTHDGRADQGLSVISWPTTDYYSDLRGSAGLEVLAAIMTGRELEEVRQKQGASYGASVRSVQSRVIPGFGLLTSRSTVLPQADETYFVTVSRIAKQLQNTIVSADELNRARQPLLERLRSAKNTNAYWLGRLAGATRDPRQMNMVGEMEGHLLSVTAEDIQALARKYLDMSRALRQQIKPAVDAKQP